MTANRRIAPNLIASYLRIIAHGVAMIFATRIALQQLGANDFGLYNLLAGTIALLSFINTALLISSQRFFSFAIGKKEDSLLGKYLSASFAIHMAFAIILVACLLLVRPLLLNHFLNISPQSLDAAGYVYSIMVISSAISLIEIPFGGLMNAFEDIAPRAVFNIISYGIDLLAAVSLLFVKQNLLQTYALIILGSLCLRTLLEIIWCFCKYPHIASSLFSSLNLKVCKEMCTFSAWNTLGCSGMLIEDEGVNITLNIYFGTAVNAAYGIAAQLTTFVRSFSDTTIVVFTPGIIQAKGAGDDDSMMNLAILSSKLSFILAAAITLPVLASLSNILNIWLTDMPEYTIQFSRFIILSFLIRQITPGLNRMIFATGKIKSYQILSFLSTLPIIPIACLLFSLGAPPPAVVAAMALTQISILIITLIMARKLCNFNIAAYAPKGILIPSAIFAALLIAASYLNQSLFHNASMIPVIAISAFWAALFIFISYISILTNSEKYMIKSIFINRIRTITN